MGNKKGCSCGYWNQVQQECLYSGYGCIHDNKDMRLEVTEDWIEDKALEVFVFLNILKPSKNDIHNVKTFIRSFVRVA